MSDQTGKDTNLAEAGFCPQCGNKMPCAKHGVDTQKPVDLNKGLDIEGAGALIKIEIPNLPESIDAFGKKWTKKPEFHVTLVGFAAKLDKVCKERFGVSNSEAKTKAQEILQQAAEGVQFSVALKDEYKLVERGEDRTVIQLCDVVGMEEFFQTIEKLVGVAVERPPSHTTLYTGENGQAIGLPTQAKLDELAKPLDGEKLVELKTQMGK